MFGEKFRNLNIKVNKKRQNKFINLIIKNN